MSYRYSTAFSHIILAGTAIYCLVQIKDISAKLPHVTFAIITVNSLIGVWRWGNPSYGDSVDKFYRFTSYIQLWFALPCIITTLFLEDSYDQYLSWSFIALPIIPLLSYLAAPSSREKFEEAIIPIGVIGLAVASLLGQNYWGVATAISYAFDYYIVIKQGKNLENAPAQDLYNYGLCFFAYFALRTIRG